MLKKILLAVIVVVLVIALVAPYSLRWLGLGNSTRISAAIDVLHCARRIVNNYRATHDGDSPASIQDLRRLIEADSQCTADIRGILPYLAYYDPKAQSDAPVLVCLVHFRHGRTVMVWLNGRNEVRAGRIWMWPTWVL